MPELNISGLLLFAAFVVPGAGSLQVYKLKVSTRDQTLKENLGLGQSCQRRCRGGRRR